MIRVIRDLRIIPIVLIASACLLALKTVDLMFDGGRWLAGDDAPPGHDAAAVIHPGPDGSQQPGVKLSWAQQMFNFPSGSAKVPPSDITPPFTKGDRQQANLGNADITGAIGPAKPASGSAAPGPEAAAAAGGGATPIKTISLQPGTLVSNDAVAPPSGAERAILERLQQRRQELDTRSRELDIRENLINAAEKRVETKLAALKQVEASIATETEKKSDAEAARFKGLVTMYENMKARDAAKIFNRLEMPVLLEVTSKINPRSMADILAQMSPDVAERLTVELASKAKQHVKAEGPAELPKIEGRPTTP